MDLEEDVVAEVIQFWEFVRNDENTSAIGDRIKKYAVKKTIRKRF